MMQYKLDYRDVMMVVKEWKGTAELLDLCHVAGICKVRIIFQIQPWNTKHSILKTSLCELLLLVILWKSATGVRSSISFLKVSAR